MTTVRSLIETLQQVKNKDTTIIIAESDFDWTLVLKFIPDSSNPDISEELRID